jgi:hypothetical protein
MKAPSSRKPRVSGTARRTAVASTFIPYTTGQYQRTKRLDAILERLGFFSANSRSNKEPLNNAMLKATTKARFSTGGLRDFELDTREGIGPAPYMLDHLVVISTQNEVTLIYASRVNALISFKGTLTKNILSHDLHLWDKERERRGDDGQVVAPEDKERFIGTLPEANEGTAIITLADYGLEARATYTHAQIAKAAGSVAKFFELLYG